MYSINKDRLIIIKKLHFYIYDITERAIFTEAFNRLKERSKFPLVGFSEQ